MLHFFGCELKQQYWSIMLKRTAYQPGFKPIFIRFIGGFEIYIFRFDPGKYL
jgi:hypothetical protein